MSLILRVIAFAAALLTSTPTAAQNTSADETAIRELIAALDKGTPVAQTADFVLFTGGMKRPFVRGQGEPELKPGVAERKGGSTATKVRRIKVAKSGDMAYEFSDVDATIIEGSGKSGSFQASMLRVWKKVDGKWHVAARFQAPHSE